MTNAAAHSGPEPLFRLGPQRGFARLRLAELWHYRELLGMLVWRDVKVRYKQTWLGFLWAILQPLLSMVVFTVLFGRLAHAPSPKLAYPLVALLGLLPWTYVSNSLSNSSQSLLANAGLLGKIYFPRAFVPGAAAVSPLVDFGCGLLALAALSFYYGTGLPLAFLVVLPIVTLLLVVLTLGLSLWLSAVTVRFRDFKYIVPFGLQLWMFASPVVYPLEFLPEHWRWVAALNPLTGPIEALRRSFYGSIADALPLLGLAAGTAVFFLVTGALAFSRLEKDLVDTL